MARLPRSSASDGVNVRHQGPPVAGELNQLPVPNFAQSTKPEALNEDRAPSSVPPGFFEREAGASGDGVPAPRDVMVALTFGLDLVQHGAMLVAAEGRPRLANRAALAILQKKDGLWLSRTGLMADRAADTRLLQKLLQDAIKTPELGESNDSPITLQRKTAQNALIVRVVPGPGLDCWPASKIALHC